MGLGWVHKYTFYTAHFSKRTLLKGEDGVGVGVGGIPSESLSIKLPVFCTKQAKMYLEIFRETPPPPKYLKKLD